MTRICFIGYGNIAKKHIEVVRHLGGNIVASCNRSDKGNQAAKSEGGIPTTYTDVVEMVEKEKPDAIINCVNFTNIYETTKTLIPYKIPILVEKPAGLTVEELQHLIELQKEYETPIQVALNRRFYSVFQEAIKSIGGTEAIDMIDVEWSERPVRAKTDKNYTDKMVEDLLIANSIHGIDLLNYYCGGVKEFNAFGSSRKGEYYHWNMAFSGVSNHGALVNFTSSWGSPVPWRVAIYTKGKRLEFAPLETCRVYTEGQKEATHIEHKSYDSSFKAGFYKQTETFFEMIKTGSANPEYDLVSSLRSTEIAEALLEKLKLEN